MVIGDIQDAADRKRLLRELKNILPSPMLADKKDRKFFEGKLEMMMGFARKTQALGLTMSEENIKIGDIYNFSLPAGNNFRDATCPGATELCEKICYVKKGYAALHEWKYWVNWAYVLLWPERFYDAMVSSKLTPVFRIHVGGDLFSVSYTRLWMDVIEKRSDVRFFGYTRSWQNGRARIAKRFIPALRELAKMPNMRLVLSLDAETGVPSPKLVPGAIRAWLARTDEDMPPEPVELIFRDKRPTVLPRFPADSTAETGSPVCPVERPDKGKSVLGKIQCQDCAWCFGGAHVAYGRRKDDLSQFDEWAGQDLNQRSARMFHGFWPERATPKMGATESAIEMECRCGTRALCKYCGTCILCLCECP